MAKIGYTSPSPLIKMLAPTSFNAAGGRAHQIDDPAIRLIAKMGGYINEPTFYKAAPKVGANSFNLSSLEPLAQEVIQTAAQTLTSGQPSDVLKIAAWARKELNLRSTPPILLALAATSGVFAGSGEVREYCKRVVQRPDEARDVFAAWLFLNGHKLSQQKIPASLKRGLADALGKFKPATILKYDTVDHPTFGDMLKVLDRAENYPVHQAVRNVLVSGDWSGNLPDDVAKLRQFNQATELDNKIISICKDINIPWQNVISKFGAEGMPAKQKAAAWEFAIHSMGEQALLMNMRNFEQAGISDHAWNIVEKGVLEPAKNGKSRMMPYRYLAALNQVSNRRAKDILSDALEARAGALGYPEGNTCFLVDTSGSMYAPVSAKSRMSMADAAAAMAATMFRAKPKNVEIIVFGSSARKLELTSRTAPEDIIHQIVTSRLGATYGHYAAAAMFAHTQKTKQVFDRVVVLTDMQMYGSGAKNPYNEFGTPFEVEIEKYRRTFNKNLRCFGVHLQGYGDTQIDPTQPNNIQLAGFNDAVLTQISVLEGTAVKDTPGATTEQVQLDPKALLEYIRANY